MNLLKSLEAGIDIDHNLAEEIYALQVKRKSNEQEMIKMCVSEGAFEFISLNASRIKTQIRRNNQ